jgi:PAS domain S-box-containing protein
MNKSGLPDDAGNNEILTFAELFDTYLSKSTAGFCLIDAGYNIVYVNKALERITGYKKDEVVGINISEYLSYPSPQVQSAIKHYTGESLKDEPPLIFEFDLIRKEGKHKWAEVTVIPIHMKDEAGLIGYIVNITDKSEIKQIEEQTKFATYAFRAIHEGTIITNTRMEIIQFNSAAENIFKIKASEAIGKKIQDVIKIIEPSEQEIKRQLENYQNDKEEFHWEHQIETSQGPIWTEVFMQKIRSENNTHIANLAIVSDITERKNYIEALNFSDAAFKSIQEGTFITDVDGRILAINEAAERIYGINQEEVTGKTIFEFIKVLIPTPDELDRKLAENSEKGYTEYDQLAECPSGLKWTHNVLQQIKDENGKAIGGLAISTDITERKEIEEKLRFSDMAIKSIREGLAFTTMDNIITSWNEACEQICGVKASEAIGKNLWDILEMLDTRPEELDQEMRGFMTKGFMISHKLVKVKEKVFWLEVSAHLIKDNEGNNIAVLSIISDVTENKKIEEALRASDAALKSIQEGTCLVNLKGEIIEINEATERIYGIKSSEVKGKTIFEFIKVIIPDEETLKKKLAEYRDKGYVQYEQLADCKTGIIWTDVVLQQIKDDKGKVIGGLGIISDITERKKIEQERADEATQKRILIDQSGDGIVVLDQNGKVYEANKRFCEMLGYTAEEIKKLHVWDWEFLETREQIVNKIKSIGEKVLRFESKHRRRNGTFYDVEITVNGANFAGQKLLFCVLRDITARKKAEHELKQAYNIINRSKMVAFVWKNEQGWPVDFVTENIEQVLGYNREEFTSGKIHYRDIIHKDDLSRVVDEVAETSKNWEIKGFEHAPYRVIKKTGEIIWVSDKTEIIRDENGNIRYYQGVIEDITERKEIEDLLRFSDAALKSIKESIVITDMNFIITNWNEASEKMFKVKASEAQGKMLFNLLHIIEPNADETKIKCEQLLNETFLNFEAQVMVEGKPLWVEVLPQIIKDANDKNIAILSIVNDISQRKETEKKLRFSDSAFKSIKEGTLITDLNYNIIDINKAGEQILGVKAKDAIGRYQYDVINVVKSAKTEIEKESDIYNKKGQISYERLIQVADRQIWVEVVVQKIKDDSGKHIANLAIFNDITRRKKMEEVLYFSDAALKSIQEGMVISDVNFNVISINKAGEEIFGIKAADVIGKNLLHQIISIEPSTAEIERRAQIYLAAGKEFHVEHKIKAPAGEIWIDVLMQKIKDNKGNAIANMAIINDITRRKQAEEAVKEEAANRKKLFEQTPVGIVIIDPQTARILDFNNAACRQLGYSRKEFAKLTVMDIEVMEDKEKILAKMAPTGRKQKIEFETLHKTKGGEIRNVNVILHPINIYGHDVYQTIWKDITERKKMEHRLRLSDEAFKSMREAIAITDMEARVLFWNKANEILYHVKEEDALGKNVLDVIHIVEPPMEQLHRDHISLLMRGHARFEHLVQVDEKKRIWVEVLAHLIKDEDGNGKAVLNIALDITERKKMEEELRKKEASLAEAQKIARIGSWYMDMESDELVWSDEMFRLFGYEPGEIVPTRELFMKHVYEEDRHILKSAISAHESGEYQEESSNIIARFLRKDGEVWYGNSKARSIFDKSGHVIKEYGSIQDISDIKQAEEKERQLQNNLTTASRMASIGEVASGLAHEINNPLTGIIGFSQLLVERDIPEDIKDDIEMINFEAQRAAKIVGGLLTFAQEDKEGFTLSDINRIILDTIDLRIYEMEMNSISIVTELDKNLPRIRVDEVKLQQAFLNIILNEERAIRDSKKKGTFTARTEYKDKVIRIFFIDDGPGIDREKLKKIFSPFVKIDAGKEGIGLGLSMSHEIITRHGGKISVQSEIGLGTKFIIDLPVTDAIKTPERE